MLNKGVKVKCYQDKVMACYISKLFKFFALKVAINWEYMDFSKMANSNFGIFLYTGALAHSVDPLEPKTRT